MAQENIESLQLILLKYRAERTELKARLALLEQRERMVEEILAEEKNEEMMPGQWSLFLSKSSAEKLPLADFLLSKLSTAIPTSFDQLMNEAIAEKIDFKGKSAARSINAAMMGLESGGSVIKVAKKLWKLKPPEEEF